MKGQHMNWLLLVDDSQFLHTDVFGGSNTSDTVGNFFINAAVRMMRHPVVCTLMSSVVSSLHELMCVLLCVELCPFDARDLMVASIGSSPTFRRTLHHYGQRQKSQR
eukprot:5759627-Pyramimonas_sp.AAC.1